MNKRFAAGTAAVLTALLLAAPASAHCGHGRVARAASAVSTTYPVCTVEGCEIAGRHTHSGRTYCGYDHAGGYCDGKCYALCEVEDCTITGRHTHDGTIYCGYDHADGYCDGKCYALCGVEGCTITGRHTHDGTAYCGSHHECGYCDGCGQRGRAGGANPPGHHKTTLPTRAGAVGPAASACRKSCAAIFSGMDRIRRRLPAAGVIPGRSPVPRPRRRGSPPGW